MGARPYISDRHLWSVAASDDGAIAVWPQTADRLYFDVAKANHLPANKPEGDNGSHVLDIGGGVIIRASGSVYRQADGTWTVDPTRAALYGTQYPSGRELTVKQDERARAVIGAMLTDWASRHEGDIAQADDIDRNNNAITLEENIARHAAALKILRRNLRRCENGQSFETYPELPTARR